MTVPVAAGDTQQEEGRSPEEARDLVAYVGVGVEGSCCSLEGGRWGADWEVGMRKEGGLEVELWVGGRRGGGKAVSGVRRWAASGRKRDLQSSSWTAGSGSPPRTCTSWSWT